MSKLSKRVLEDPVNNWHYAEDLANEVDVLESDQLVTGDVLAGILEVERCPDGNACLANNIALKFEALEIERASAQSKLDEVMAELGEERRAHGHTLPRELEAPMTRQEIQEMIDAAVLIERKRVIGLCWKAARKRYDNDSLPSLGRLADELGKID